MKSSIHTYEIVTRITYEEYESVYGKFKNDIIRESEKEYLIKKYCNSGLRIIISKCKNPEEYKNNTKKYKLKLIITPFKLINHGEHLGFIETEQEFKISIEKLNILLKEAFSDTLIEYESIEDFDLRRVDISADVENLTEEQIKEYIAIAKRVRLSKGYKLWNPTKEEIEKCKNYDDSLSTYQNNQSRGTSLVLYDKGKQLSNLGYNEETVQKAENILRFEIQLKSKALREFHLPGKNEDILTVLLKNSRTIIQENFTEMFDGGCFLSSYWMYKYAKRRFSKGKREKMRKIHNGRHDYSRKTVKAIKDLFSELWINPVSTNLPFLPSIHRILECLDKPTLEHEMYREENIKAKSRKKSEQA